jgi:PhnB protein
MKKPTLVPHIVVRDGARALGFYESAFGAEVIDRSMTPDGSKLVHSEVRIGDSLMMVCDEFPEMGPGWLSPQSLQGTSVTLNLTVADADDACAKSVAAGAEVTMPVEDTFWGARFGKIRDPFGHEWTFSQEVRQVSEQEIAEATAALFS